MLTWVCQRKPVCSPLSLLSPSFALPLISLPSGTFYSSPVTFSICMHTHASMHTNNIRTHAILPGPQAPDPCVRCRIAHGHTGRGVPGPSPTVAGLLCVKRWHISYISYHHFSIYRLLPNESMQLPQPTVLTSTHTTLPPLSSQVCYLRHAFGLGEHYNSLGKATASKDES